MIERGQRRRGTPGAAPGEAATVASFRVFTKRCSSLRRLRQVRHGRQRRRQQCADVQDAAAEVSGSLNEVQTTFNETWSSASSDSVESSWSPAPYKPPRKNWRIRRSNTPIWFKQRHGVRRHVQSGAARVARHRPRR